MEKSADKVYRDMFDLASCRFPGFSASPTEWRYNPFGVESPMIRDEAFKSVAEGKRISSKRKKKW